MKNKKIQKYALKILCNFFDSDYLNLINLHGKATMKIKRLTNLAFEVF